MKKHFVDVDCAYIADVSERTGSTLMVIHMLVEAATLVHNDIVNNNDDEECHFNFKKIKMRGYNLYLEICTFLDVEPVRCNNKWTCVN